MKSRWDPCVTHRGQNFETFVQQHFVAPRQVLFIGGAGFDPRSTSILQVLTRNCDVGVHALFVVESRLPADAELVRRAEENMQALTALATSSQRLDVPIFATDLAPIGGQQIVEQLAQVNIGQYSDVLIDLSALSVGISFPTVKYLWQLASSNETTVNVHLAVIDAPSVDHRIRSIASDRPTTIHGFKGAYGLEDTRRAVRLWMPQLMTGKQAILRQIHSQIRADDVLPIVPFPSRRPRLGDELLEEYHELFESEWSVDVRNVVYAEERNPLDVYRTILRITDAREAVFRDIGGALTILSPSGTKVLAIGTLMAALDRDFPVVYVEASSYEADFGDVPDEQLAADAEVVHVFLAGEAYEQR